MTCASCGEPTRSERCPSCHGDTRLDERYTLDAVVGQGASGITYRATRISDGATVA